MVATNHALTGALIGLTVSNPLVAVVAAFFSHFVLDAIPHFGMGKNFVNTKAFKIMLSVDASLCIALVGALFWLHHSYWLVPAICAFAATSPDLWHIRSFQRSLSGKVYEPGLIARFSAKIQWFERPIGAVIEAVWAVAVSFIVASLI